MPSWLVLVIATSTWIIWIPAAVLQKTARGEKGRVSIFPVLPLFPGVAWACAAFSHSIRLPTGATSIGVGHVVLLVAMLASIAKSLRTIRTGNFPSR